VNPPKLKKALVLAREAGLSRDDRLDLASHLYGHPVASWKALSDDDLDRLLDHLSGWFMVEHLRREH